MSNLDSILQDLGSQGIKPIVEPEGKIDGTLPMPGGLGALISNVSTVTTGLSLDTTKDLRSTRSTEPIVKYLRKLNFDPYVPEYYDCEDRAFWGVAHVRRVFPGTPIGIAVGTADYLSGGDGRHAVIIIWWESAKGLKHLFYDPAPEKRGEVGSSEIEGHGFRDIKSVLAFPTGNVNKPPNLPKELPILNNIALQFDPCRLAYPLETKDPAKPGILEYLEGNMWKEGIFKCSEDHKPEPGVKQPTYDRYYKDYDRALLSFAHVRRAYPGCPVGIALGTPKIPGGSTAVLAIWRKTGGISNYFDPSPRKLKRLSASDFTPKKIFV